MALYGEGADLGPQTRAYTPANEIVGMGYTPGGIMLKGFHCGLAGKVAFIDWSEDPIWPVSTFSARYGLIYNASKDNMAVSVVDFGESVRSTNAPFRIELPPPGETAVIGVS